MLQTSATFFSLIQLTTILIFCGSIEMPSLEMTGPKNMILGSHNSLFLNFPKNCFSHSHCKTSLKCCSYSCGLFEYIKIPSMNMITNTSRQDLKTRFIISIKVIGALDTPKWHNKKLIVVVPCSKSSFLYIFSLHH